MELMVAKSDQVKYEELLTTGSLSPKPSEELPLSAELTCRPEDSSSDKVRVRGVCSNEVRAGGFSPAELTGKTRNSSSDEVTLPGVQEIYSSKVQAGGEVRRGPGAVHPKGVIMQVTKMASVLGSDTSVALRLTNVNVALRPANAKVALRPTNAKVALRLTNANVTL